MQHEACSACSTWKKWLDRKEADRRKALAVLAAIRAEQADIVQAWSRHAATHPAAGMVHLKDRDTGQPRCGAFDSQMPVVSAAETHHAVCPPCRLALLGVEAP